MASSRLLLRICLSIELKFLPKAVMAGADA